MGSEMCIRDSLATAQGKGPSYRVLDGALETLQPQSDGRQTWVLVIPDGDYRDGASWKSFVFESAHVGPFGGHRNADQTLQLLLRWCSWISIDKDVRAWIEACIACAQFRAGRIKC